MAGFLFAAAICCGATVVYEVVRGVIAQRGGAANYTEHYQLAIGGSRLVALLSALALMVHALGAKYF